MPTELQVHAENRGAMMVTATDGDHIVAMDYPVPGDDDRHLAGMTPLRLLLASLAGCSANSVAALLRRMRQPVTAVEVDALGTRRDEHPTVITEIALAFIIHGPGVDGAAVERALTLSEDRVCPVWAMLKPGTRITATYQLADD